MMSNDNLLTPEQAREIQEQLFATYRQQTNRHVPVPVSYTHLTLPTKA